MNPLIIYQSYKTIKAIINDSLKDVDPYKLVFVSVGSSWIIISLWSSYSDCQEGVLTAAKNRFFKNLR